MYSHIFQYIYTIFVLFGAVNSASMVLEGTIRSESGYLEEGVVLESFTRGESASKTQQSLTNTTYTLNQSLEDEMGASWPLIPHERIEHNATPRSSARIINLGMSRSGSTSLHAYLTCKGLSGFHYKGCKNPGTADNGYNGGKCAFCIDDALQSNGSVSVESLCGTFDFLSEYNFKFGPCIFPCHTQLGEMVRNFPGSKYLLPTRDPWDWLQSVKNYNKMDVRFLACTEQMGMTRTGRTRDAVLMNLYVEHSRRVRRFFRDRNRLNDLLEYRIDAADAEAQLDQFLGYTTASEGMQSSHTDKDVGMNRSKCYGNVNPSLRPRGHRPSDDDLRADGVILLDDPSDQDPSGDRGSSRGARYSRRYGTLVYKFNFYLDYIFGWY